jgi:hypothetical protein
MVRNDFVKIAVGLIAGIAVAIALAASGIDLRVMRGDVDTGLTLSRLTTSGSCTLSGKETEIHVGKNKKVNWKIRNYCTDSAQTVSVGTLRASQNPAGLSDCSAPSDGSVTYPFTKDSLADRSQQVAAGTVKGNGGIDPGEATLSLKVKNEDLFGTYYFDICLGGQKVDPRLIIER